MSISYHKNGLVSNHQFVGRCLVFCSKNTWTKQIGYQQPTCLCQDGIRGLDDFNAVEVAWLAQNIRHGSTRV